MIAPLRRFTATKTRRSDDDTPLDRARRAVADFLLPNRTDPTKSRSPSKGLIRYAVVATLLALASAVVLFAW